MIIIKLSKGKLSPAMETSRPFSKTIYLDLPCKKCLLGFAIPLALIVSFSIDQPNKSSLLSTDFHIVIYAFSGSSSRGIEKFVWDSSGERLALSFKDGNELYQGLIAVYDVRRSPLVSVSLVGFIRGPGEGSKPLAFAFHNKFKQGPLLSVCWSSGWCCTYPLILRSH
ncbi:hypothetical protein ABZP36_026295 [Zizania latifolia]